MDLPSRSRILCIQPDLEEVHALQDSLEEHAPGEFLLQSHPNVDRQALGASRGGFDLVLFERPIFGASDLAAVSRLRGVERPIPVIIRAGHVEADVAARALDWGAHSCLVRGHTPMPELVRIFRGAVEEGRSVAALVALEEGLRDAVARSAASTLITGQDGTIVFANGGAERLFGPSSKIVGRCFAFLDTDDGEAFPLIRHEDGEPTTAALRIAPATWWGRPAYVVVCRELVLPEDLDDEDRRIFPRVPTRLPVVYETEALRSDGRTIEISAGGLSIHGAEAVDRGEPLYLTLSGPQERSLSLEGTVAHVQPANGQGTRMGVAVRPSATRPTSLYRLVATVFTG